MNSTRDGRARQLNQSDSTRQDAALIAKGRSRPGPIGPQEGRHQPARERAKLTMLLPSPSETAHGMFDSLEHVHLNAHTDGEVVKGCLQAGARIALDDGPPVFEDGSPVGFVVACPCKSGKWDERWFPAPLASGTGPTLTTGWKAPLDEIRVIGVKSRDAWMAWAEATLKQGVDPVGDDNGTRLNRMP